MDSGKTSEIQGALDVEVEDAAVALGKSQLENHPMVYRPDDILNYEPRENDIFLITTAG